MNSKAIIVLLLGVFLSACSTGRPSTTIDVTMTDFQFTPNSFTVPAGKEITLNAINNGAVVHEFVVFKLGADAGDEFGEEDEQNIYWEVEVLPGQSAEVTFIGPTEPGEYDIVCGIEGHLMAGMVGTLTVVIDE